MNLGRFGVWTSALDAHPMPLVLDAVRELDELPFGAIWTPEAYGREIFASSALMLAASRRLVVATGIANLWARDAMSMQAGQQTLASAHPGRFLLGVGVSHQSIVESTRGKRYERPFSVMRDYLDSMDAAEFRARRADEAPQRLLAALGPRMLRLAAERADGAHPYFVPVEHTALARELLGPDRLLCPEQAVVLEADKTRARAVAREYTVRYLLLPNYVNNLRRLGWSEDDLAPPGSDRLIDAVVAWGDDDAVRARVHAHLDAGADHVAVQVLTDDSSVLPMAQWRRLAEVLRGIEPTRRAG